MRPTASTTVRSVDKQRSTPPEPSLLQPLPVGSRLRVRRRALNSCWSLLRGGLGEVVELSGLVEGLVLVSDTVVVWGGICIKVGK